MHISFKNSEGLNVCNCHENNATMHKTISMFLKVGFIFFRQTWFGVVIWAGRAADSHVSVCCTTLCCRRHSCRSVRDAHSSPAGHRRTADCPAPRRPSTCVPRSSGPPTSWTEHRLQHTHTHTALIIRLMQPRYTITLTWWKTNKAHPDEMLLLRACAFITNITEVLGIFPLPMLQQK